ncbi:hypothetical protein SNE40_011339 [Patella caerulea]|uniref:HBS1-like protein N-terminal domain-containing protein n=1 Tax=Patella caerulea TaxID=87958 RepID=A0AAN8PXP3_PATCE
MSRHRNVRSMNYEEYYDEDDDYSQSVEDNYCISPGTVAQFTFNRDKDVHHLASYMGDDIPEEDEESEASHLNDSASNIRKTLSDVDQGKLNSCLDEIRNILGDTSTEQVMSECVLKHNFNTEKALNELLSQAEAPKPQRQPRENRRNRSQVLSQMAKQPNKIVNSKSKQSGRPGKITGANMADISMLQKCSEKNGRDCIVQSGDGYGLIGTEKISHFQLASQNKVTPSGLKSLAGESQNTNIVTGGLTLSELANQHKSSTQTFGISKPNAGLSLANKHEKSGLDLNLALKQKLPSTASTNQELSGVAVLTKSLQKPDFTLSTQHSSPDQKILKISLTDLAKNNQSKSSTNKINKLSEKSADLSQILAFKSSQSSNISLASLTVKKPSKAKKSESNIDGRKLLDRRSPETLFEETDNATENLFFENNPSTFQLDSSLMKNVSGIGKVICMTYTPNKDKSSYMTNHSHLLFSYAQQAKNKVKKLLPKVHQITPFQFSTPSPDDIVKEKQKAAFR